MILFLCAVETATRGARGAGRPKAQEGAIRILTLSNKGCFSLSYNRTAHYIFQYVLDGRSTQVVYSIQYQYFSVMNRAESVYCIRPETPNGVEAHCYVR